MRVWIATTLLAATLIGDAFAQASAPAFVCGACDRALDLDETQWRCLLARLPALRAETTPDVQFTLDAAACQPDGRLSSIYAGAVQGPPQGHVSTLSVTPDGGAPPAGGSMAPSAGGRVFRLSRSQLDCLAREVGDSGRGLGERTRFDFDERCGRLRRAP